MMSSLPLSGKRKKGASRVFGEAVFNEIDASLCYTPSPGPSSTKSAMGPRSFIRGIREECELEPPEPMFLFQSSEQLRTETSHTFEKCLSFGTEKENCNGIGSDATVQANSSTNLIRKNELIRLRANNKSPIRSALVKITEAAIDDATNSIAKSMGTRKSDFKIHESLTVNVTREPKSGILRVKSKTAKSVRFQRDQEKSQSKTLRDKVEESRRDIRAIQRQLSSAHFKEKAKKDEAIKMQRFACLEKEYTFNSEIFRDHQQTLKQERDKSRKMSTETRAKIRRNNRAGEEKLKILRRGEEEAMLEVRADLHKARMEATRANSETRRLSFQFRAGDARKIRVMRLKWKEIQLEKEHESYELTRAASKDVERHKKLVEKEKRDDAKSRNLEARRRRKLDEEKAGEAMLAEHKSYELKWAGEQDAKAYQIIMRDERRKSLSGRNKESARHAKVMEELRGLAKEKEAESYILKWAGENDAKAYLAKLADDRRKSLQFRATEAREQRSHEEEEHATAVQKAREEGILQSACRQDVEKYKAECEERRRKSFQFRGKQTQLQRLEEEQRRLERIRKDEVAFKLDSLARKDVEEYYKDCQRRRRKSLALRAKEARQHVEWNKRRAEQEVEERAHTSHLQSLDIHHMALAREKERARMAMEALRSAGCILKGNPFGDLLNGV